MSNKIDWKKKYEDLIVKLGIEILKNGYVKNSIDLKFKITVYTEGMTSDKLFSIVKLGLRKQLNELELWKNFKI